MGAAETLAADPDFAKLHAADPKMAEGLMLEALKHDQTPAQAPLPDTPSRTPLEGNVTDDRANSTSGAPSPSLGTAGVEVARTVRNAALPAAGSMAGAFVGGLTGPFAPAAVPVLSGVGAELGNVANKALGWQEGQWNKPDASDAFALASPLAAQLLLRPVTTAKNIVAPFAKSSQAGKEAANSVVATQNAELQSTYDLSVAAQAKAKAVAGAEYKSQVASWNILKESQAAAQGQAAEDAKRLAAALPTERVQDAARWAAQRPGIPTTEQVKSAYTAADTLAQAYRVPVALPELAVAKKTLLSEAAAASKTPGAEELSSVLTKIANSGQAEGLTIGNIQDSIRILNKRIAALGRSTDVYATERRDALRTIVTAMETGMDRLTTEGKIPSAFRETLRTANSLYLKQRTHEELSDFLTQDMVKSGTSGQPQFNPQAAINALDNKTNARMVGYMQKIKPEDGGGKNLYEMTKDMLTAMASKGQGELDAARELIKSGGTTIPPQPVNPVGPMNYMPSGVPPGPPQQALPYPKPTSGPLATVGEAGLYAAGAAGGFAAGGGVMNPIGGGIGGVAGLGFPKIVASMMMTGWGQKTLLALVRHQGTTITPATIALATAAIKAGESPRPGNGGTP